MLAVASAISLASLLLMFSPEVVRAQERVYEGTEEGVVPPEPVKRVHAKPDESAAADKIKGTVRLKVVVSREGKPQDITVYQSLDPRLDAKAIAAAKQWQFKPARLEGKAVPCRLVLEFNFRP